MKYDKVKAAQMAGNQEIITAELVNKILSNFDDLTTYPINTPLQNYHNVMQCVQEAEEIIHQALGAALNQLRVEKPELFKPVNYNFAPSLREEEMAKQPLIEYEGCKFRVGKFANFINLGRKDARLGMQIKNAELNNRQGTKMYKTIVKTIGELLKQKEYKRAKPRRVEETIYFDDLDVVYDR